MATSRSRDRLAVTRIALSNRRFGRFDRRLSSWSAFRQAATPSGMMPFGCWSNATARWCWDSAAASCGTRTTPTMPFRPHFWSWFGRPIRFAAATRSAHGFREWPSEWPGGHALGRFASGSVRWRRSPRFPSPSVRSPTPLQPKTSSMKKSPDFPSHCAAGRPLLPPRLELRHGCTPAGRDRANPARASAQGSQSGSQHGWRQGMTIGAFTSAIEPVRVTLPPVPTSLLESTVQFSARWSSATGLLSEPRSYPNRSLGWLKEFSRPC